jgi:hypothetical protein
MNEILITPQYQCIRNCVSSILQLKYKRDILFLKKDEIVNGLAVDSVDHVAAAARIVQFVRYSDWRVL